MSTTTELIDLFEFPEQLPKEVQDILNRHSDDEFDYESCQALEDELKPLGYIFDWGLDAQPHNLRMVSTK